MKDSITQRLDLYCQQMFLTVSEFSIVSLAGFLILTSFFAWSLTSVHIELLEFGLAAI